MFRIRLDLVKRMSAPACLRRPLRAALPSLLTAAVASAQPAVPTDRQDYSAAERALFMSNQLAALKPPTLLHYRYHGGGSLQAPFDDRVTMALTPRADGGCCAVAAEFLSGARRLSLPEVEAAEGNPVILYFLERDIREMQRLTRGQQNYFRKRIRMAVYQGATIREVSLPYKGGVVAAREISIAPYADDPLRQRFQGLADKRYTFVLSDAVPGGVYALRSFAAAVPGGPALQAEELLADGAESSAAR